MIRGMKSRYRQSEGCTNKAKPNPWGREEPAPWRGPWRGKGPEALEAWIWQEFPPSTLHSTTTPPAGARRETGRKQRLWGAPLPFWVQVKNGSPNPRAYAGGPRPAEPPVSSTMKMRFRFSEPGLISFTKVSAVMLPEPQHPTRRGKGDEGSMHGPSHVHFARPIYHTRLVRQP